MSQEDRDEAAAFKKGGRYFRSQFWDRSNVVLSTVAALVFLIGFVAPLVGKLRSPDSVTAATQSATTLTSVPAVDATTPDTAEPSTTTTPATTAAPTTSPPTPIAAVPATTLKPKSTTAVTVPAATVPAATVPITTAPVPTTSVLAAPVLRDVSFGTWNPATLKPPLPRCAVSTSTATLVWNLLFHWAVSGHLAATYSVLYRRNGETGGYSTAFDAKNNYSSLFVSQTSTNPTITDPLTFKVGLRSGETAKSEYSLDIRLQSSTDSFDKILNFACPTK